MQVTLPEAQQRLPELLDAAAEGQVVEIQTPAGRCFELKPRRFRPRPTGVPQVGTCQGIIEMADDFDAPLVELREYMP